MRKSVEFDSAISSLQYEVKQLTLRGRSDFGQTRGWVMLARKPAGRNASAMKYDLLTVMGAYALASDKGQQRLVLRLMTLVTARYNWQREQLAVGQREIARLWSVDERTVKREMAKLRAKGWLEVTRQGARGRVSEYRLAVPRILADTRPHWASVGPDLENRLTPEPEPSNVVPMSPRQSNNAPPDIQDGCEWSLVQALLFQEDGALFDAWIRPLTREGRVGGRLLLSAPSRFHANYVMTHLANKILVACAHVDPGVTEISVT